MTIKDFVIGIAVVASVGAGIHLANRSPTPPPAPPAPQPAPAQPEPAPDPEFAREWGAVAEKKGLADAAARMKQAFPEAKQESGPDGYSEYSRGQIRKYFLKDGELPILARGDFDCDGKPDDALSVSGGIAVLFADGKKTMIEDAFWDAIALGKPGKKDGYDGPFVAECEYIEGLRFESASRAYTYDRKKGEFSVVQTSD